MTPNSISPTMFTPFTLWTDLALRTTEMLVASGQVIGSRVGQMARAGANPSALDVKEFNLMGREKITAATQSGMALAAGLQSANYELMARGWQQWFANAIAMSSLASSRTLAEALSGQSRLMNSLARTGSTQSRLSSHTAKLLSAALEPVHGAATANAKRLARPRKGP